MGVNVAIQFDAAQALAVQVLQVRESNVPTYGYDVFCAPLYGYLIDGQTCVWVSCRLEFPVAPGMFLMLEIQRQDNDEVFYCCQKTVTFHNRAYSREFLREYFSESPFTYVTDAQFDADLWDKYGAWSLFYSDIYKHKIYWIEKALLSSIDDKAYFQHEYQFLIKAMLPDNYSLSASRRRSLQKIFLAKFPSNEALARAVIKFPWQLYDKCHKEHPTVVSFQLVDMIAQQAGCPVTDPVRLDYACSMAIKHLLSKGYWGGISGNCFVDASALVEFSRPPVFEFMAHYMDDIRKNVGPGVEDGYIFDTIFRVESRFLRLEEFVADDGRSHKLIYDKKSLRAEKLIAEIVSEMVNSPAGPISDEDVLKALVSDFKRTRKGFKPNAEQVQGFENAFRHRISVITGGPGAGKTALVSKLIKAINKYFPEKPPIVVAPTGKAVKQIELEIRQNCPGKIEYSAHTIAYVKVHSKLDQSFDPAFDGKGGEEFSVEKSAGRFHIIDESSMASLTDFAAILQLARDGYVIIVGDNQQLPPISQGQVFRDLFNLNDMRADTVPAAYLQGNHRVGQGAKFNCLLDTFNTLRQGRFVRIEDLPYTPGVFEACLGEITDETVAKIVDDYEANVIKYGIENVICIAPVRNGIGGSQYLNWVLEDRVNPVAKSAKCKVDGTAREYYKKGTEIAELLSFSRKNPNEDNSKRMVRAMRIGDRVIITRNSHCEDATGAQRQVVVANGDTGELVRYVTNTAEGEKNFVVIRLDSSGDMVRVYDEDFDIISLGYAMTVHKAQGSGYSCVMVVYDRRMRYARYFNSRNMFYTAITRTKESCYIYGEKAVFQAGLDCLLPNRNSRLPERIAERVSLEITGESLTA